MCDCPRCEARNVLLGDAGEGSTANHLLSNFQFGWPDEQESDTLVSSDYEENSDG